MGSTQNISHLIVNSSFNAVHTNCEPTVMFDKTEFQLISLFFLQENSKNAFSIFVFILMAGVFVSRDENSLLDLISLIIRKR